MLSNIDQGLAGPSKGEGNRGGGEPDGGRKNDDDLWHRSPKMEHLSTVPIVTWKEKRREKKANREFENQRFQITCTKRERGFPVSMLSTNQGVMASSVLHRI